MGKQTEAASMADQRTALIFGAGKIGRGFVAEVLSRADCQLYFVDSDQELSLIHI